jgi:hypothetical protein
MLRFGNLKVGKATQTDQTYNKIVSYWMFNRLVVWILDTNEETAITFHFTSAPSH